MDDSYKGGKDYVDVDKEDLIGVWVCTEGEYNYFNNSHKTEVNIRGLSMAFREKVCMSTLGSEDDEIPWSVNVNSLCIDSSISLKIQSFEKNKFVMGSTYIYLGDEVTLEPTTLYRLNGTWTDGEGKTLTIDPETLHSCTYNGGDHDKKCHWNTYWDGFKICFTLTEFPDMKGRIVEEGGDIRMICETEGKEFVLYRK